MRRSVVAFIVSVLVVAFGLASASRVGLAQEATPSAEAPILVIELAPGVTAEIFAGAPSDLAPGQTLYLARFTFQPGAEIFPHCHPGTTVLGVVSCALGWTLEEGTAQVIRGAAAGATEPTETLTEAGAEVVLNPGDAIYYEDDVVHTARGASDQPAVVPGTLLLESGAPLLIPAEEMALDMSCAPAG